MKFNADDYRTLVNSLDSEKARHANVIEMSVKLTDQYDEGTWEYTSFSAEVARISVDADADKEYATSRLESVNVLRERTLAAIKRAEALRSRCSAEFMARAAGVRLGVVYEHLKAGKVKLATWPEIRTANQEAESSERQLADAVACAKVAITRYDLAISEMANNLYNANLAWQNPAAANLAKHELVVMKTPKAKGPAKLARMEEMNRVAKYAEQVPPWVIQQEEDRIASEQAHAEYLENQRIQRAKAKAERQARIDAELAFESDALLRMFGGV